METPTRRPQAPTAFKTLALSSLCAAWLAGCEPLQPKGVACTMELRFNYCLTLNGANTVPEDVVITRDRKVAVDTLDGSKPTFGRPVGACFPEANEPSVLKVFKAGVPVAQKQVGAIPVVDGCHAKDTVIAITW